MSRRRDTSPRRDSTRRGTWFQKEAAPEEPFLLTGDGNLIDLRWAVQYRVKDAVAFAFNLAEPDAFVRGVSLAALRGVVARSGIDAIYTSERSGVERQVATGDPGDAGQNRQPASRSCRSICCTSIRRPRSTTRFATSPARRKTSCARSIAPTSSRWSR